MNVPKLRFKEFNDEWIEEKINELVELNPKNPNLPENFIYIDLESVSNGILLQEKIITKDDAPSRAQRQVKVNDILYQTVRPYQKNNLFIDKLSNLPYIASTGYAILREKNIYQKFLFNKLHTDGFVNEVLDNCTGTSYPAINSNDLGNIKIFYPNNFKEQKKIGDFLSLLDKKIELQTKKIEDLKLFKKGLSNDLINGINEYKEFSLKDIGITYSGLSGKSKEDFESGNSKFVSFMSILKDKIEIDKLPTVMINGNEKQNKVQKYDLFFNTSSETKEEVALCSTINEDVDNLYLNSFCFGYRINDLKLVNNEYLNIMLHCTSYRKLISNLGQGFTRVNISKNELMDLVVKVPSIDDQIKIVDIINKVKSIIDLEAIKLSKLQELKKGLMQNMFV